MPKIVFTVSKFKFPLKALSATYFISGILYISDTLHISCSSLVFANLKIILICNSHTSIRSSSKIKSYIVHPFSFSNNTYHPRTLSTRAHLPPPPSFNTPSPERLIVGSSGLLKRPACQVVFVLATKKQPAQSAIFSSSFLLLSSLPPLVSHAMFGTRRSTARYLDFLELLRYLDFLEVTWLFAFFLGFSVLLRLGKHLSEWQQWYTQLLRAFPEVFTKVSPQTPHCHGGLCVGAL